MSKARPRGRNNYTTVTTFGDIVIERKVEPQTVVEKPIPVKVDFDQELAEVTPTPSEIPQLINNERTFAYRRAMEKSLRGNPTPADLRLLRRNFRERL